MYIYVLCQKNILFFRFTHHVHMCVTRLLTLIRADSCAVNFYW